MPSQLNFVIHFKFLPLCWSKNIGESNRLNCWFADLDCLTRSNSLISVFKPFKNSWKSSYGQQQFSIVIKIIGFHSSISIILIWYKIIKTINNYQISDTFTLDASLNDSDSDDDDDDAMRLALSMAGTSFPSRHHWCPQNLCALSSSFSFSYLYLMYISS